ncbi:hypothetical protein U1Q18_027787 [Sarracenia purpurea var. burkii]
MSRKGAYVKPLGEPNRKGEREREREIREEGGWGITAPHRRHLRRLRRQGERGKVRTKTMEHRNQFWFSKMEAMRGRQGRKKDNQSPSLLSGATCGAGIGKEEGGMRR